jgi:quercetin dioxygenase-like cupin family protein
MITSIHSYGGVTATVYVMNAGDKIPRHQHPTKHTTSVAAGHTEVEIWTPDDTKGWLKPMWTGESAFELPPNLDHEIRALEDGTVVVNLSVGGPQTVANATRGEAAQAGGVELHDGTAVDAD